MEMIVYMLDFNPEREFQKLIVMGKYKDQLNNLSEHLIIEI